MTTKTLRLGKLILSEEVKRMLFEKFVSVEMPLLKSLKNNNTILERVLSYCLYGKKNFTTYNAGTRKELLMMCDVLFNFYNNNNGSLLSNPDEFIKTWDSNKVHSLFVYHNINEYMEVLINILNSNEVELYLNHLKNSRNAINNSKQPEMITLLKQLQNVLTTATEINLYFKS